MYEFPGCTKENLETIGPLCQKAGITADLLASSDVTITEHVHMYTNGMIVELCMYKERTNTTWEDVTDIWCQNLFHQQIPLGTIQSNWSNLKKKLLFLRGAKRSSFAEKEYHVPQPKPKLVKENEPAQEHAENTDDGNNEDDLEYFPAEISDHTVQSLSDCMTMLTDLCEDEVKDHLVTQCELDKSRKKETQLKEQLDEMKEELKDVNKELKSCLESNLVRRLKRKEIKLNEKDVTIQKLHKKIESLELQMKTLQKKKKNLADSRRYFQVGITKYADMKKDLQKQIRHLESENKDMKSELDEIMTDKDIVSFEKGRYASDIRLVCFELIARGVGSNHVSDIIRIVLNDVAKMNVGRLPKPTLIRYLAVEQALLNKESARAQIQAAELPLTLHTDGTTKKRRGYTTFLASTGEGTVGMSLHDIDTETADCLLQDTEETLDELVMLNLKNKEEVHQILSKVKTTMTDRSIVNKCYITKLEKWRASVLPEVMANWEELDEEVKQELATLNDLYCGKHLILNLQEYAGSALCEWEVIEADGGKLGREKKVLWNRSKTESGSLLAVRTFCSLLGPECDEQSGMVREFGAVVPVSYLVAYRGNRFNIPFENSAAVYHHINDFFTLCDTLDAKREVNMYVKSLKGDFEDDIILAGIRAMGIIGQHVTGPLMRMVESKLHIMDTDKLYTRLHQKVQEWIDDPTPLINDSCVLFVKFPPLKNAVHKSLYDPCSASVEHLTKQALSIILHSCLVCITRQVADHLPGGRFHEVSDEIRMQTQSCPKDNICAERIFAGLDYLRRKMPNANTVAFEGILLWSLNKTRDYLDSMPAEKKEKYLMDAMQQRKAFLQLYQNRSKHIKERVAEKLRLAKLKKEDKQREKTKQCAENTANALKVCGMLCTSLEHIEVLKQKAESSGQLETFLKSQLKYWKCTCTNKGGLKRRDAFNLTRKGQSLSIEELESNLRYIISEVMLTQNEPEASSSVQTASTEDKEEKRNALKQKLLDKLSPTKKKRRGPFPGDRIIHRRIRHSFLDSEDGKLMECKGTVLRKASDEDIENLVERGDRKFTQTFSFYTVLYDPPYEETMCYPLEKEWDEGSLDLM